VLLSKREKILIRPRARASGTEIKTALAASHAIMYRASEMGQIYVTLNLLLLLATGWFARRAV
jgi:hypothetical protein